MFKIGQRLTYANVMSTVAVFVALGGGAYAIAQLPANSVGAKQLKKSAVTSKKIKDGAIVGADINKAKLGPVPSATHAVTAGAAATAGKAGTATQAANGARRIDFRASATDPAPAADDAPAVHVVLALDALTIRASCIDTGGGEPRLYVTFASSQSADLDVQGHRFNNPGTSDVLIGHALSPGVTASIIDFSGVGGGDRFEVDEFVYRDNNRAVTLDLALGTDEHIYHGCDIQGTATPAPA
jgi:hypothetical protein